MQWKTNNTHRRLDIALIHPMNRHLPHGQSPPSFVRGGFVDPWTGSTRHLGLNSYYWSTTAYPAASHAYYQRFNSANVYPSRNDNRAYAFSVRCLAL